MITYEKYSGSNVAVKNILKEASEDPYLGEVVYQRFSDQMILFKDGSSLVGFAMPRLESGFYRVGPIYVIPSHRSKGIAADFLRWFFEQRSGRAYIAPSNTPSRKSFTSAGFVMTGKVYVKGADRFLQFEKRVSKSLSW